MSAKCVFISDLHVKSEGDEASKILNSYLSHQIISQVDTIYLLGDIFDFLVGEHRSYIKEYPSFFQKILALNKAGKKIIFFEGNHDFHFSKTMQKFLKKNEGKPENFHYLKVGVITKFADKKIFVCHGYEIDYYNKYFKRWYKIYTSVFMNIFLSYMPFVILKRLANWASSDSKRRGKKTFDFQKMKDKYLTGSQALIAEKKVDGVIGGHTHIPEFHEFEDKTFYYNVGFPVRDKHFLHFNGESFEKVIFD